MKVRALLFDLGNVLIDYRPEIFIARLAQKSQIPVSHLTRYFLASMADAAYTEGKISSEDFFQAVLRDLKLPCNQEEFRQIWCSVFAAKPEMDPLVASLKKFYPVWVLSNTNEWHFEFLKANYPILQRMDRFFLSYEMKCQKPKPEIFETVIRATGFKPQEIFFTDDIQSNVLSAQKAGLQASLFTSPSSLVQELKRLEILNHEK